MPWQRSDRSFWLINEYGIRDSQPALQPSEVSLGCDLLSKNYHVYKLCCNLVLRFPQYELILLAILLVLPCFDFSATGASKELQCVTHIGLLCYTCLGSTSFPECTSDRALLSGNNSRSNLAIKII